LPGGKRSMRWANLESAMITKTTPRAAPAPEETLKDAVGRL